MRLWHKELIDVLPRQQLISQWRECCLIMRQLSVNGTPHHILVNKITDYPLDDFVTYTLYVQSEMEERGYRCDVDKFNRWVPTYAKCKKLGLMRLCNYTFKWVDFSDVFKDWHNYRYLEQCYFNLEEKYDCGGIDEDEWNRLYEKVCVLMCDYV